MARIPGVPTLDPVEKPRENPREMGKVGEAIGDFGDTSLAIVNHVRQAQSQVDTLAARNQLNQVHTDIQDQLAKTQNSRDVDGVIQSGKDNLARVADSWSKSPAALAIQMDAQSLNPSLDHLSTVKQIDLMTKEGKIQLTQAAQTFAQEYAKSRGNADAAGEQNALAAYEHSVNSLVTSGLMGDAEAQESIRSFKESGQELQIRNAISNAEPSANMKIHEEMANHPEMFPDVKPEVLDTYKGQALSAFESHTKFQEWSQGQDAVKTKLIPLINLNTNPADGVFNEGSAMKNIADGVSDGSITPYQEKVLSEAVHSHAAELSVSYKQDGTKRLDAVEDLLTKHQFGAAKLQMEQDKGWFEEHGLGADHAAELHYMSAMETQARAEAATARTENRYEYMMQKQIAQDNSNDTFNNVAHLMSEGASISKAQIYNLAEANPGKGKLSVADADRAWKTMQAYQKEPDFKAGIDYINGAFAPPKGSSNDTYAASDKAKADTLALFQQQVNADPKKSKLQIAQEIVKSKGEEQIKDQANKMFGGGSSGFSLKGLFSHVGLFSPSSEDNPAQPSAPPRPANVPEGYHYDENGPKGKGWYK